MELPLSGSAGSPHTDEKSLEQARDSGFRAETFGSDMTIEEYLASKDLYRISSNGIPLTPPFKIAERNAAYVRAMKHYEERDLDRGVIDVLSKNDLEFTSLNLQRRYKPYSDNSNEIDNSDNSNEIDTLVVETSNESPSTWKDIALQVKAFVEAESYFKDVDVEIYNGNHSRSKRSSILNAHPETLSTLKRLEPEILEELRSSGSGGLRWTSLTFHNRAPKGDLSEDAKRPTVIVMCQPSSRFDYVGLEARPNRILAKSAVPLDLEIIPGRISG